MKNGRADHDDEEPNDPKIARIEDARRRKQLGLGGTPARESSKSPTLRPHGSIRDWLIGGVIIALALGYIAHLTRPIWQGLVSAQ